MRSSQERWRPPSRFSAQQVGIVPKGFRSPAWEMTPHMLGELKRRGLYDSSLSGFDHPYTIGGVTEVPVQWAIDDAVYFKFVGGGADSWPPSATGPILDSWIDEWSMLHKEGGLLMLTIHDWISGRAHRIRMLESLLQRVTAEQGAWIATVGEVAAHHAASANADALHGAGAGPGTDRRARASEGDVDADLHASQAGSAFPSRPGRRTEPLCG